MKHGRYIVNLILSVLLTLAILGPGLPYTRAQQPNRVGLVVRHGDGKTITRCIEFGEPEISGYEALTRSGLNVVASFDFGQGAAVCAIEGQGCPIDDCLTCAYPDYWAYWHLVDGNWVYSQLGSSSHRVHNGDVEGWNWGAGDPPPVVSFDQICPSLPTNTPPPTDTPPPTNTPVPPTNTPAPPTATSPPPAPEVWFRLDDNPITAGTCTTVRWDSSYTQAVYLDGERVDLNGSREVCPTTAQEYRLRIVGETKEQTETLVLGVTGAPPTATPMPQSGAVPSQSPAGFTQAAAATAPLPSPTSLPPANLTPSPSPVAQASATPSVPPSPTPMRVALAPLASTPIGAAQPATTPPQVTSTAQPTQEASGPSTTPLLGYISFNFIMIGLLSWLMIKMLRRR